MQVWCLIPVASMYSLDFFFVCVGGVGGVMNISSILVFELLLVGFSPVQCFCIINYGITLVKL